VYSSLTIVVSGVYPLEKASAYVKGLKEEPGCLKPCVATLKKGTNLQVDDVGALWENFCIAERKKYNHYMNNYVNTYFWRTYDQKEIDYIEEKDGKLFAYEFKWKKDKVKIPELFLETYDSEFEVIAKENYFEFLL
jgi:predicted AAA+ superfamily ATPase